MAVRLTVRQRSEAGGADKATEVLLDDEAITIGRDKSCEVMLAQMAVSRNHARITRDGTLFFVEDLGSAYGTTVNGKPLPRGEKRLLRNGDTIAIAQFDVVFDRMADKPQTSAEKTSFLARHVVKDVMRGIGSGEGPYFRVMSGPKEGQRIEIADAQELVIGREEGVDVVLIDDLVSRRHAKIRRDWSGTHVEDLSSRNGIKVNKKRTARKTLKDRDELEIGSVRLLYLDPAEVRETPLVLAAQEEEGEGTLPQSDDAPDEPTPPGERAPGEDPEPPAGDEDPPADGEEGGVGEEEAGEAPDPEQEYPEPEQAGDEDHGGEDEPGRSEEAASGGGKGNLLLVFKDPRKLVPLAVMGVAAILAVVLLVAMLAGA